METKKINEGGENEFKSPEELLTEYLTLVAEAKNKSDLAKINDRLQRHANELYPESRLEYKNDYESIGDKVDDAIVKRIIELGLATNEVKAKIIWRGLTVFDESENEKW